MKKFTMICIVAVFLTALSSTGIAEVKTVIVQPKGEFSKIETQKTIQMIKDLRSNTPEVKSKAMATLLKHPNDYAPPALFVLSDILFAENKKPQAMFWFYLAQLRTRSDVNKSDDPSVNETAQQLSQEYGEEINAYAKQHLQLLKKVVKQVIQWDARHKRNYDPRWIALSGAKSYTETTIDFKPQNEWNQIDAQTRKDYYRAFKEALKHVNTN